jgi:hypothetical protein
VRPKLVRLLPESYRASCDEYCTTYQTAASQIRALVYRTMCPALIRQANVLQAIADDPSYSDSSISSTLVGAGKSATGMWVQRLVGYCSEVWQHMSSHDEWGEAGPLVHEQVWLELCQACFDTAMEGFFRSIRRVGSAGREAMLRDVGCLQEELDKIHPCHCRYGLEHVEAALRAAQGEGEEVMLWVQDHYQQYAYRHLLGLVTQTFGSMMDITQTRLKDAVSFLDELYSEAEREDRAAEGEARCRDGEFAHLFSRKSEATGSKKGVRQSLSQMGSEMSSGMSSLVKGMSLKK